MHHTRFLLLLSNNYNDENLLNKKGFLIENDTFPTKAKDKVEFFKKYSYPDTRGCFTWHRYEQILNISCDKVLTNRHSLNMIPIKNDQENKTVFLKHNIAFCIEKWLKFEPQSILNFTNGLDGDPVQQFIKWLEFYRISNEKFVPSSNHKVLILKGELMYNELLDKSLYDQMVEFLGITNEYEHACELHKVWFGLHVKAKQQCINWIKNSNYPDFPWKNFMAYGASRKNLKITEEEFYYLKEYLKKIYEVN